MKDVFWHTTPDKSIWVLFCKIKIKMPLQRDTMARGAPADEILISLHNRSKLIDHFKV